MFDMRYLIIHKADLCIYTYTYIYTYIYIYTYTHTHIYIYICISGKCFTLSPLIELYMSLNSSLILHLPYF